jgi:hypothetical protein
MKKLSGVRGEWHGLKVGLPLSSRTLPRFSAWWGVPAVGTSDMLFPDRAIVHARADPPKGAKKAWENGAWVHLSDQWVMSSQCSRGAYVELVLMRAMQG